LPCTFAALEVIFTSLHTCASKKIASLHKSSFFHKLHKLFVLDKFFLFWSIFYCCTLLRSKLSSPCHTPFVTNISLHKSCLTFLFVWFLEKFSFFGWVFCCYKLLFSKLSSSHCLSSPLFYVLEKLSPFF